MKGHALTKPSFRGTPRHPDLAFDETAKALAKNGVSFAQRQIAALLIKKQCFAKRMFRIEDLQAYMMRLFLEYAVSSGARQLTKYMLTLQRLAADEGVDMVSWCSIDL